MVSNLSISAWNIQILWLPCYCWRDQHAWLAVILKIPAKFYFPWFAHNYQHLQVGWLLLSFYKADSDSCSLTLACSRGSACGSFCWHFRAQSGSLEEASIKNKSLENYTFRKTFWVHLGLVCFDGRWFADAAQFGIKMYFRRYMSLDYLYYFAINYLKYFTY